MGVLDHDRIDEELENHLELLVEHLERRGMERSEAEREAERRFGKAKRYREECRRIAAPGGRTRTGEGIMAQLGQDLSYAVRGLFRAPAVTLIIVLTLALGIGMNTAIFSVITGVLLRPLGVSDPETLVFVRDASPALGVEPTTTSIPALLRWREETEAFSALEGFWWQSFTLEDPADPAVLTGVGVTEGYFRTVGLRPFLGRLFTDDDATPGQPYGVVAVSHRLWLDRFGGDPAAIGRTIVIDGAAREIVGVMPPRYVAPGPTADLLFPYEPAMPENPNYGVRFVEAVGRLAPGASVARAEQETQAVYERIALQHPQMAQSWTAAVVPFRDHIVGGVRRPLVIAFGAVGVLLLVACANVANLLLARATARSGEMAVRTALGATRWRIVRQLVTESAVLGVLGGAAGVAVAYGAHRVLLGLEPGLLPRTGEIRLDLPVLLFALGLSLATGVAFGLAPAVQGSVANLASVIKEGSGRGMTRGSQQALRKLLVTGQVGLTLLLLTGAGLLVRTFLELRSVDPGFDPEGVVAARVFLDGRRYPDQDARRAYNQQLLDRVRRLPGVTEAGLTSSLPMDPVATNYDLPYRTEDTAGQEDGEIPQADLRMVSPGYFETIRARLLAGRLLDDRDHADAPLVMMVNRTMAERAWPGGSPVGRRVETVQFGWKWYEVVGVVDDTRYYGLGSESRPEMYIVVDQVPFGSMTVVARTAGSTAPLLEALRRAVLEVDPIQPPQDVLAVAELVAADVAAERFYATLLGIFAAVALALAAAGLYGLLSYWVGLRRRELGVRIAMGATRPKILRLVLSSGMMVVALGILAGLAAAFATTRLLASMLFGVQPLDPLTFAGMAGLLALVAALACLLPAWRASRMDPVEVLKEE